MKFYLLLPILFVLFSCASQSLIKDSDYSNSLALYRQSEFQKSLDEFPQKEENGFITSTEKAWLRLWNKTYDNSLLETQIKSLDQRKYTSLSSEAEYFFFNESEDGYLPSEHEIIVLHLINSMIYLKKNKLEDAEVEARRAGFFLQNVFDQDQPHFDDPGLRIWLAAIWMSLGKWGEAQVDLRKIYELTKNKSILKLSERNFPPPVFKLVFKGSGPELTWKESSYSPDILVPNYNTKNEIQFSTQNWYNRHIKRNTVIRDTVLKSNYMSQYLGIKLNAHSKRAAGFSMGTTIKVVGIALGVGIIGGGLYALSMSSAVGSAESVGYIFAGGAVVASYFWKEGDHLIDDVNKDAANYEQRQFEKNRMYRLVRFLPNQISAELSLTDGNSDLNILEFKNTKNAVQFVLQP